MAITAIPGGGTIFTGKDIKLVALLQARSAMKIWVDTGGKMMATRGATPGNIARAFGLVDPKTGKAPKTAVQCLKILTDMIEEEEKKNGTDPRTIMAAAQGKALDINQN